MIGMDSLHEASILYNLRRRFDQDIIYVSNGTGDGDGDGDGRWRWEMAIAMAMATVMVKRLMTVLFLLRLTRVEFSFL